MSRGEINHDRTVTLRMPSALCEQIESLAAAEERTESAMIRLLLRHGIIKLEQDQAQRRLDLKFEKRKARARA